MKPLARTLSLLLLTLSTCSNEETSSKDQVLTLNLCPPAVDGLTCGELVADGHSTATVRVCSTVTDDRRTDLTVALVASNGRFAHPKDAAVGTVAEIALGADKCGRTTWVMPTEPGTLDIQAELAGYHQRERIDVKAAAIGTVELTPSVFELTPGQSSSVAVAVKVKSLGGAAVSAGTKVSVTLTPTPSTAYASVYPKESFLDANGASSFTLYASAKVTELDATVTAEAPTVNDLPPAEPPTLSSSFHAVAESEGGAGGAGGGHM